MLIAIDDIISRCLALNPEFVSIKTAPFPEPRPFVEPAPYKVGNKWPPKEHQFKKGQSGNKRGRPKRRPSLHSLITKQLQKTVTVSKNGKSVKMTNYELMTEQLISSVVKKDWAALKILKGMLQESYAADEKSAAADYWADREAEMDELRLTQEEEDQLAPIIKEAEEMANRADYDDGEFS
jgi:Family of unknown function (DUF5681)